MTIKFNGSERERSRLVAVIATVQALVQNLNISGWKMPRIRMPGRSHPHHSKQECDRRRLQVQHIKQVRVDAESKKWPANCSV